MAACECCGERQGYLRDVRENGAGIIERFRVCGRCFEVADWLFWSIFTKRAARTLARALGSDAVRAS